MRREAAALARLRTETPAAPPPHPRGGALGEARAAHVPDDARDRAIRFGVAYHEAMEAADFNRPFGARAWAVDAARRHCIDAPGVDALEELVSRTLASPTLERARRAVSAGRAAWRELPFVRQVPDTAGFREGKIDLLFEEDGGWVLVDYKTDKVPPDGPRLFAERYRAQIQEYRAALRELGMTVKAAYLLLARTGETVEIADLP